MTTFRDLSGGLTEIQKEFLRAAGVDTSTGVIDSREQFDRATDIVGSGNNFIERDSGGNQLTATGLTVVVQAVTPPSDPVPLAPQPPPILPIVDPEFMGTPPVVADPLTAGMQDIIAGFGNKMEEQQGEAVQSIFGFVKEEVVDPFTQLFGGLGGGDTGETQIPGNPLGGFNVGGAGNLDNLVNFVHTKQRRRN